jgi:tetratricopeptide (TPR) repeat protein
VIAYALAHLAYISHYQGRYEDGRKFGEASLEAAQKTGDAMAQAFALNLLAMVFVNSDEFEIARDYHLQAIELCQSSGDRYGLARAYSNLSELIRIQGHYAEAKPYTMEGLVLARELGNRYAVPIMLINLVYSQVGLGEIREAYASLREALQLNLENDAISWVVFSLVSYANILAAEGKREQALNVLGLCMHHPETNSDTHRDIQIVLENLKKVRGDDIQAGLDQGKSMDLKEVVVTALGG